MINFEINRSYNFIIRQKIKLVVHSPLFPLRVYKILPPVPCHLRMLIIDNRLLHVNHILLSAKISQTWLQ